MVNQRLEGDILFNVAIIVSTLSVILVNTSVMSWLVNETRSLVDQLILVDCAANIGGQVAVVLFYCQFTSAVPFCMFKLIVTDFFRILNQVVPIAIAIYRWVDSV